jgi:hypothetical protein
MRRLILKVVIGFILIAPAARCNAQATTEPSTRPTKIVALDYFYNHQVKDRKQFAYVWEDTGPLGYSQFGQIWKKAGATLGRMEKAPTRQDLDRVSVYIIASPSNEENAAGHKPNIIGAETISTIVGWVKDGGVLAIFANGEDCDIEHLNDLARPFGATFHNPPSEIPKPAGIVTYDGARVEVKAEMMSYSTGSNFRGRRLSDIPICKGAQGVYVNNCSDIWPNDLKPGEIQELLTIYHSAEFKKPFKPNAWIWSLLGSLGIRGGREVRGTAVESVNVMASSNYGRGMVIFVGCPWFENRSLDYSSPTLQNDNRIVAGNLVLWLLGVTGGRS